MDDVVDQYVKLDKIGEGQFSVVYRAKNLSTGDIVALKKLNRMEDKEEAETNFEFEVHALKNMTHENVVSLLEAYVLRNKFYLVLEYAETDLRRYLDTACHISIDTLKALSRDLLNGLAYCHGSKFIHRDIKPPNLLIDSKGRLKIGDFGCVTPVRSSGKYTPTVCTIWYRSPEVMLTEGAYGPGMDIWSAACVIAEMHCRRPLFPGDGEIDQLLKIFMILGTPNEEVWPGYTSLAYFKSHFPVWPSDSKSMLVKKLGRNADTCLADLLLQMLTYDPDRRISAQQALDHAYLEPGAQNLPEVPS